MFDNILKSEKTKIFLILFLICALGFSLRIYKLDSRSIWADEAFSLFESTGQGLDLDNLLNIDNNINNNTKGPRAVKPLFSERYQQFLNYNHTKGLKDVARSILMTDTQPPLYFFIMHFWIKYFGGTLFSLRFFAVLLGIVSIIAAFLFTSAIFNKKTALFAALFLAVSPFAVFYSQEGRHYSLILAISLLSSYFLVRLQKEKKEILPLGFVVTTALGLYIHYFYVIILLAHTIYFTFFSECTKEKKNKFCIAFLISLIFFFPWILAVLKYGYNFKLTEWVFGHLNNIASIANAIVNRITFFFITLDNKMVVYRVINLIATFFLLILARVLFKLEKGLILPSIIFIVSILIMTFIDILEKGILLLQERYYTFAFVGLIPIIGYVLAANWNKKLYKFLSVFLFLALMMNSWLIVNGFAWQVKNTPRTKNVCSWINQEPQRNKVAVILYNRRAQIMPMVFYLKGDIVIAPFNDSEDLEDIFRQFSRKMNTIFIVQSILRYQINYIIDKQFLVRLASDMNFLFRGEREFINDDIKVIKFVSSDT